MGTEPQGRRCVAEWDEVDIRSSGRVEEADRGGEDVKDGVENRGFGAVYRLH